MHSISTPRFFPSKFSFSVSLLWNVQWLPMTPKPWVQQASASIQMFTPIWPQSSLTFHPCHFYHLTSQLPWDIHSSWRMSHSLLHLDCCHARTSTRKVGSSHTVDIYTSFKAHIKCPSWSILIPLLRLNCFLKVGVSETYKQGTMHILLAVSPVSICPTLLLPKEFVFCSALHMYPLLGNVTLYPQPWNETQLV